MSELRTTIEDAIKTRFGEAVNVPPDLAGLDTLASLVTHRTHRSFNETPVSAELLRLLCACALSSPAKSDLQQADIVVVSEPAQRTAIAELIPSMPWLAGAPEFLVVCGNSRRFRQLFELHPAPFTNDHLDAFFNATADAALVLGHCLVAAEAVGLGTCPISVLRNHAAAVSEILTLPAHVFPLAGLCLGWPDQGRSISPRLPMTLTVHQDRYDEGDWRAQIKDYDERRGRLDGWDPQAEDFRGWSLQKAKQYAQPERADFGAFIRDKGFCLD